VEKKKVTIITSETHEVLVVRQLPRSPIHAWCSGCSAEAEMITPADGALVSGVSARTIYRWVEAGSVHFAETAEGLLLICQQSLAETCGNRSAQ
jgi:hypothetical protein